MAGKKRVWALALAAAACVSGGPAVASAKADATCGAAYARITPSSHQIRIGSSVDVDIYSFGADYGSMTLTSATTTQTFGGQTAMVSVLAPTTPGPFVLTLSWTESAYYMTPCTGQVTEVVGVYDPQAACPPGATGTRVSLLLPSFVAWKRRAEVGFSDTVVNPAPAGYSLSVDGGTPLAISSSQAGFVVPSRGSKSMLVSARWVATLGDGSMCTTAIERRIKTGVGVVPALHVTSSRYKDKVEFSQRLVACSSTAAVTMSLKIAGRTVGRGDACSPHGAAEHRLWRLNYDAGTFSMTARTGPTGASLLRFVYRSGTTIRTGWVTLRRENTPSSKIFSDTDFDQYINYCVNRSRPVYAQGGRIYCVYPADHYAEIAAETLKRTLH